MKKLIILLLLLSSICVDVNAGQFGDFVVNHSQRMSFALEFGGLGGKKMEAFSLGGYASVYGFTADVSVGCFDNFEFVNPFDKSMRRTTPILSEYLFGYAIPVWSDFNPQYKYGFTIHVAPVLGWYKKEYSNVMYNMYEDYENRVVNKQSYGIIATLEYYNGLLVNVKATPWGGAIGVGYCFLSPYRKGKR